MNILDIIAKKRDGKKLDKEEIEYFIQGYTDDEITDYQAAALVMAIYINGMDYEETKDLTLAMAHSGDMLDLSDISDCIIDKHSSGGVGDKITLIVMPIVASLGITVAKMSGRGLGITGGTIDKLESIPGFRTDLNLEEFKSNIKQIGISIIGQTKNLTPADKKLYALRDTISCVGCVPLIASSIMSKKIAAGAKKLVLEVTCGSGAFMKTKEDAENLSRVMKKIGELAGIETICVITNMQQPIGKNVGNSLEVEEAIRALKGEMQEDIREIVLALTSHIVRLSGKCSDSDEIRQMILENINNGKAYQKFVELIGMQGGDTEYLDNIEEAQYVYEVTSDEEGYVQDLNAELIGRASMRLGAGRVKKSDEIDHTCGIVLEKKIGDYVEFGETLGYIHSNRQDIIKEVEEEFKSAYIIGEEEPEEYEHILNVI